MRRPSWGEAQLSEAHRLCVGFEIQLFENVGCREDSSWLVIVGASDANS